MNDHLLQEGFLPALNLNVLFALALEETSYRFHIV
jgi:hypothetical protein